MAAEAYQWNAADYAQHSRAQTQWAQELLGKLELSSEQNILDLGCGDGKISALLAWQLLGGTVIGIDASADMVELARCTHTDSNVSNLRFIQMDARELRFDRQFEVIFSNAVLHWLKEHPVVLAGCQRSLRSGGRLLLQMGGKGNAHGLLSVVETVIRQSKWQGYFSGFVPPYYFYAPEDYAVWLPEAGFSPLRIELIPKIMQHAGRSGLAGWLRTTWMPYTERVPMEMRDDLIGDIVDAYLHAYPLDKQGKASVSMIRLEVEAIKA